MSKIKSAKNRDEIKAVIRSPVGQQRARELNAKDRIASYSTIRDCLLHSNNPGSVLVGSLVLLNFGRSVGSFVMTAKKTLFIKPSVGIYKLLSLSFIATTYCFAH